MLLDELRAMTGAVQVQPLPDVISHTDIQRTVLSAGENITAYIAGFRTMGSRLRGDDVGRSYVPAD